MGEDIYIQPTTSAIYAAAWRCPNFFWSQHARLDDIAEYYQIYKLRVRWDTKGRSLVVDLAH